MDSMLDFIDCPFGSWLNTIEETTRPDFHMHHFIMRLYFENCHDTPQILIGPVTLFTLLLC